jgi:hypothetical protein
MSIAPREPKWSNRALSWAGHEAFTQRQATSSASLNNFVPHVGHFSGIATLAR